MKQTGNSRIQKRKDRKEQSIHLCFLETRYPANITTKSKPIQMDIFDLPHETEDFPVSSSETEDSTPEVSAPSAIIFVCSESAFETEDET